MQCAIQRRSVYLAPTATMDRHWIARLFDDPSIHPMFGFKDPAGALMGMRMKEDPDLIVGTIRLSRFQARIGFVLMFPPTALLDFWEFGYAITAAKHRNAFNAVNAMDAMAHYTMDLRGLPVVGGRTRDDNRAAAAIALRSGHKPAFNRPFEGHDYTFWTLDQAGWARRKQRLAQGEAEHPWTGGGQVFHVLDSPPYTPVPPLDVARQDA